MSRKKYEDKGELILQAATAVFSDRGYHQTSISQIATEAGIGDGTIYNYFDNKEHILETLFHETIHNQFVPGLKESIKYFEGARLILLELIRYHYQFFGSDYQLARVIQIESRQSKEKIRKAMQPGMHSYFRVIESVIKKGQEEYLFLPNISVGVSRKMIFGTLDEIVTNWVLTTEDYSLMTMIEPTYRLLLNALLNRPSSDQLESGKLNSALFHTENSVY